MSDPATGYWAGCEAGTIRYQRCPACGHVQSYPRPFCEDCGGRALEWRVAAGEGTVYAMTRVTRAPSPEFKALVPYDVVLVSMDEGFRIMAHGGGELALDDRVRFEFKPIQGKHLPVAVRI